jgi:hypothetical protein
MSKVQKEKPEITTDLRLRIVTKGPLSNGHIDMMREYALETIGNCFYNNEFVTADISRTKKQKV